MSDDKNLELLPVTYTSILGFLKKLFSTLSKFLTFCISSKIILCLIPGNKGLNSYGDKPENRIIF